MIRRVTGGGKAKVNGEGLVPVPASRLSAAGAAADGAQVVEGRKQKGMARIAQPRMPEDALRRMDHTDWLETFGKVMQMETGVAMTPMRAGVINRLNLAAEYLRLLQVDIRKLRHDLDLAAASAADLRSALRSARVEIERQKDLLNERQPDRELDSHDDGGR